MPVECSSVMMKPRPISWRGDAIWPKFARRPTPWNLHGIEAGDSQQPSYELLIRMTTPTSLASLAMSGIPV